MTADARPQPRKGCERVDPSMAIEEPWHCGDCIHIKRCTAMFGVKGTEPHCDFAPSRFRLDAVGTLVRLVESAGAQVTLYGEPVTADELRMFGRGVAAEKIRAATEKANG